MVLSPLTDSSSHSIIFRFTSSNYHHSFPLSLTYFHTSCHLTLKFWQCPISLQLFILRPVRHSLAAIFPPWFRIIWLQRSPHFICPNRSSFITSSLSRHSSLSKFLFTVPHPWSRCVFLKSLFQTRRCVCLSPLFSGDPPGGVRVSSSRLNLLPYCDIPGKFGNRLLTEILTEVPISHSLTKFKKPFDRQFSVLKSVN